MAASQVLSPRACLEAGQISSAGGLSRRATFQEDETYEAKVARLASPLQRLLLPVAPTALLAKQGSVKFGGNYGVPDSVELYGIHGWGAPYFSVSAGGNLVVSPLGGATALISPGAYAGAANGGIANCFSFWPNRMCRHAPAASGSQVPQLTPPHLQIMGPRWICTRWCKRRPPRACTLPSSSASWTSWATAWAC